MKIKEVKESKNRVKLQKKIKSVKKLLIFGRFLVCFGGPIWLSILGSSIQETNETNVLMSIFALGVLMTMHYQNHDRSHELYKLKEQLSKMEEEQENTEEYTRSLSR